VGECYDNVFGGVFRKQKLLKIKKLQDRWLFFYLDLSVFWPKNANYVKTLLRQNHNFDINHFKGTSVLSV